MHSLFQRAGLPPPQLTLAAPIGGVNDPDIFAYAMEVWRLMLPIAEQLGLVTNDLRSETALNCYFGVDGAENHIFSFYSPGSA